MRQKRYDFILFFISCLFVTGWISCGQNISASKKGFSSNDEIGTKAHKTQNLVVVTLDGYRWQEVFKGADSALLHGDKFISQNKTMLKNRFWSSNIKERRRKLMPFFWNTIKKDGKLYGNRDLGCKVNVKNPYWFSYPGYSEIWTGFPDPKVNSNGYPNNPNYNVLEFINKQPDYKNKVAVFSTWKAFRRILNKERNGLYQISGEDSLKARLKNPAVQNVLDEMYATLDFYSYNRYDSAEDKIAYAVAKSYMKEKHPKVLYIAFGHTDNQAHAGHYDFYLEEAHNIDAMIGDLWAHLQKDPFYKGNTTLFITCDHGRGIGDDWTSHGKTHPHSDETWCAIIGPDTKPLGEVNKDMQLYHYQYARSFAALLGLDFHPIGDKVKMFMDD